MLALFGCRKLDPGSMIFLFEPVVDIVKMQSSVSQFGHGLLTLGWLMYS